jgi:histidinol-phosphate aminotransferase
VSSDRPSAARTALAAGQSLESRRRLPIREAIIGRRRDSYLDRLPCRPTSAGASGPEPIDCLLGCGQWGVSPLAAAALRAFDPEALAPYPERHHETLLAPLLLQRFERHGVTAEQLFFGHGSFNILERVVHKLVKPGRMIGIGPQFPEVPWEFQAAGGSYRPLPLDRPRYSLPLDAIETAIRSEAIPLVYVDNPNNPLGRHFPLAEMEHLAASCAREATILVVDEALGDFVPDEESCVGLTTRHDCVVVTRSFSKAFGLAAERVGYAFLSPRLAGPYRQVDVPFEPGLLAATLARESLRDTGFLEHVRAEARSAKTEIVRALEEVGLRVLPTHPGVSILTAQASGRDLSRDLLEHGVLVQPGSCFARTHPGWNDSYCRLRIAASTRVAELCTRIRSLR